VPVANIGAQISWPLIIIGLMITSKSSWILIEAGILAFSLSVLFQLVTLPVEFNASRRAIRCIADSGMMYGEEIVAAKKVLNAAALTYVASAAGSILQLLRLVMLTGGRRRND
jgi:Zn-dependent membrane protease YugP